MKQMLGVFAVTAALAFAGGVASTTANAASSNDVANAANRVERDHAASGTDMSARRRHWRRYHYVRPYPYVYPYSYGYYRPRPYYYRPYGYYAPGPFFSFGFGPRHYW
jgi:hypothetical protein